MEDNKVIKYRVPPRGRFQGFDPKRNVVKMTGKEWNELAQKNNFEWKRTGDPREGIKDLCGGGYEVWID